MKQQTESKQQVKVKVKDKIVTIPNILSISRLFCWPFVVYFLLANENIIALYIILLALLTDILDGYIARRTETVSKLGMILDPLSDKIGINSIAFTLSFTSDFPLWLALAILVRDILIVLGALFVVYRKYGYLIMSNMTGRITVMLISLGIITHLNIFQPLIQFKKIFDYTILGMLIMSLLVYIDNVRKLGLYERENNKFSR